MATLSPTQQPTPQQPSEFTTRHSFSYRDGANNKYHLKDSLEIDNSLANLLEKKLYELYKLKEDIKSFHPKITVDEIESLFKFLDKDNSGAISKIEFWNFYTTVVKLNIEISKLFKNSYPDGSSTILTKLSIKKENIENFIILLTTIEAEAEAQATAAEAQAKAAEAQATAAEAQAKAAEAQAAEAQAKAAEAQAAEARAKAQAAREKINKLREYLRLYNFIKTFNEVFNVNLDEEIKVEDYTKDELVKLYGMLDENFDNQLDWSEIMNAVKINNSSTTEIKNIEEIFEKIKEIFELLVKKISIMIDLANIKSKLQHEYEDDGDHEFDFDTQKNHLKYLFHSLEISEKFLSQLKSKVYDTSYLQNDIRLLLDIHHCISIEDERPIKRITGCYNAIYKSGDASTETNVILRAKYDQDMPIDKTDKTDKSVLNNINKLLKLLDELQSFIYIFLKNEINLIHVLKESKLQLLKTKEKLKKLKLTLFKSYKKELQLLIENPSQIQEQHILEAVRYEDVDMKRAKETLSGTATPKMPGGKQKKKKSKKGEIFTFKF